MFAEPQQYFPKISYKEELNQLTIELVLEWLSDSSVHPRNKVNSYLWFHIPTLLTTHIQPQQDQQNQQNTELLSQLLQRMMTILDGCFDSHTQIPNKRLLRSSLSQLSQSPSFDPKIEKYIGICFVLLDSVDEGPFAIVETSQLDVMKSNDRTIAELKEQIAHQTQMELDMEMLLAKQQSHATANNDLRKERIKFLFDLLSLQRENERLRDKLASILPNLVDDPESPLFLNWYPNDPITVDSYSRTFLSLVSMVKNGYKFEGRLPLRASFFLESLNLKLKTFINIDVFLRTIGQGYPDPAAVFVDSVTILLTSPHPPIFRETLFLICKCLEYCSLSTCLALISAKLIPRILSAPCLIDLSFVADKGILNRLVLILRHSGKLSITNSESVRDVVLHDVLIPIEPSLVQISRNSRLLAWIKESEATSELLARIFEVSAFHQPTLNFVCSSHLPMAYQSLLSVVDTEDTHQTMLGEVFSNIGRWKKRGAEFRRKGRILLQTLEREGFVDGLD
ncbi:hypothetical protein BLNAU_21736 [Blattamonas nauphoetae]|uniref:Uncharacterized protein n=1 Tax=Blattamonas nauphoetae TaxID=2049346 RepID=A0ABQ9WXC2_9EUKA|nr:hypothetical protein BLNAU_21736 [Blattamonas nauphoetae]